MCRLRENKNFLEVGIHEEHGMWKKLFWRIIILWMSEQPKALLYKFDACILHCPAILLKFMFLSYIYCNAVVNNEW